MSLPLELLHRVGLELSYADLSRLCQSSSEYATLCNDNYFWYQYYKQHYRSAFVYYESWDYHTFVKRALSRYEQAKLISDSNYTRCMVSVKYNYDVQLRKDMDVKYAEALLHYAVKFPYIEQAQYLLSLVPNLDLRRIIDYISAPVWDNIFMSLHDDEKIANERQRMLADTPGNIVDNLSNIIEYDAINLFVALISMPTIENYVESLVERAVRISRFIGKDFKVDINLCELVDFSPHTQWNLELRQVAYRLVQCFTPEAPMILLRVVLAQNISNRVIKGGARRANPLRFADYLFREMCYVARDLFTPALMREYLEKNIFEPYDLEWLQFILPLLIVVI